MNKDQLSGILLSVAEINFLHFAFLLFVASILALIAGSLSGGQAVSDSANELTIKATGGVPTDRGLRRIDMVYSTLVLLTIGWVWLAFSG